MEDNTYKAGYVYLISMSVAIGGFLFGYDTAVVSGAIGFMEQHFTFTPAQKGFAVACALIGCVAGAAVSGTLSDRFGRKKILIVSGFLFAISAISSAIPITMTQFVVARIIGGLGVGAASMVAPLYISEVSPAAKRGRLVSLQQLAIVVGILIVYFINTIIQGRGDEAWNVVRGWRWMFGSEIIPALFYIIMLLVVPESPRWLAKQGRHTEARDVLARIGGRKHAETELAEIETAIEHEGDSVWQLFKPGLGKALAIASLMAIFQQAVGITAVMYYAPEIFKSAGAGTSSAFTQTVMIGAINLVFTFVAMAMIDKFGRKALMMVGSIGTGTFLLVIARAFFLESFISPLVFIAVLGYIASFAMSLGPVVWVYNSEIFPTRIRGRAMSIATFVLWVASFTVSQTFPMLVDSIGSAWTFVVYAVACFATFLFVLFFLPETKGRTLEEIEQWWQKTPPSTDLLSM